MKRISIILALFLAACTSEESYKDVRNEVVTIHDKVMADGELLLRNRAILDSLQKGISGKLDSSGLKAVNTMLEVLKKDEALMDKWMEDFQAEVTGKSNSEAVDYFNGEKRKILVIDSIYKADTKRSEEVLGKLKQQQ